MIKQRKFRKYIAKWDRDWIIGSMVRQYMKHLEAVGDVAELELVNENYKAYRNLAGSLIREHKSN